MCVCVCALSTGGGVQKELGTKVVKKVHSEQGYKKLMLVLLHGDNPPLQTKLLPARCSETSINCLYVSASNNMAEM